MAFCLQIGTFWGLGELQGRESLRGVCRQALLLLGQLEGSDAGDLEAIPPSSNPRSILTPSVSTIARFLTIRLTGPRNSWQPRRERRGPLGMSRQTIQNKHGSKVSLFSLPGPLMGFSNLFLIWPLRKSIHPISPFQMISLRILSRTGLSA